VHAALSLSICAVSSALTSAILPLRRSLCKRTGHPAPRPSSSGPCPIRAPPSPNLRSRAKIGLADSRHFPPFSVTGPSGSSRMITSVRTRSTYALAMMSCARSDLSTDAAIVPGLPRAAQSLSKNVLSRLFRSLNSNSQHPNHVDLPVPSKQSVLVVTATNPTVLTSSMRLTLSNLPTKEINYPGSSPGTSSTRGANAKW